MKSALKTTTAAIAVLALAIGFTAAPVSFDVDKDGISVSKNDAWAKKGRGRNGDGVSGGDRPGNNDADDGTADQGRGDAPGTEGAGETNDSGRDGGGDDGTSDQGRGR